MTLLGNVHLRCTHLIGPYMPPQPALTRAGLPSSFQHRSTGTIIAHQHIEVAQTGCDSSPCPCMLALQIAGLKHVQSQCHSSPSCHPWWVVLRVAHDQQQPASWDSLHGGVVTATAGDGV
jgi:hypothetical protein